MSFCRTFLVGNVFEYNTEETNNIVQYQFHFIGLFICSFGINQSKIIK
jgi:hypothetical protein